MVVSCEGPAIVKWSIVGLAFGFMPRLLSYIVGQLGADLLVAMACWGYDTIALY